MKFKQYHDGTLDFRTGLWIAFWLYILQAGDPDMLDALIALVGRMP